MRILQVAHGFPPDQMAGAEVYTWTVSKELVRQGHDVRVFVPGFRPGVAHLALVNEDVDGVKVTRLNLVPGSPHRLRVTYTNPVVDEVFARWVPFVVAERKDVVVTLDWTDHAQDKQATIAISINCNTCIATMLQNKRLQFGWVLASATFIDLRA